MPKLPRFQDPSYEDGVVYIRADDIKTSMEVTISRSYYEKLKVIASQCGYSHNPGYFILDLLDAVISHPNKMVLPHRVDEPTYTLWNQGEGKLIFTYHDGKDHSPGVDPNWDAWLPECTCGMGDGSMPPLHDKQCAINVHQRMAAERGQHTRLSVSKRRGYGPGRV